MALPFRTGDIVSDEYFTDRATEVGTIRRAMRGGGRLLVYGERRQGKSSAIRQASLPLEREGAVVAWVDLWTTESLVEVARRIVAGIPFRWSLKDRLQLFLAGLGLEPRITLDPAGNPSLAVGVRTDDLGPTEARETLVRLLHGLDEMARDFDHPVVIVLDEFQRIEELTNAGGGLLRGIMQETPDLSYVLAGSVLGPVERLIAPKGPLHAIDRLDVGPIPPAELIPWIKDRMLTHGVELDDGAGEVMVEEAGPRTEYIVRLAQATYLRGLPAARAGTADVTHAFEDLVADRTGAFEALWATMPGSEKAVLRAVAAGIVQLHGQAARRDHELPTSSSITKAVGELRQDGHLGYDDPPRFSDPFFRAWVLTRAMPDGRQPR